MKKILILVTKGEIGGAQIFALNLARGLKKKNLKVTVGFGRNKNSFLEKRLRKEKIETKVFHSLSRNFNSLKNLFFFLEIRKYLSKEKFDILQLNSSNAIIASLAAKLSCPKPKVIFTFHGLSFLSPYYKNLIKKLIFFLVLRFFLLFVDKNIFVSKEDLIYARKINLVKEGIVIYNGLDGDFIEKKEALNFLETKIGINLSNKLIIGSIGRLAYPKNYEFLIENAPILLDKFPNLIFLIIGEGMEREKYQKLIKKFNLENIFFLIGEIENGVRYIKAFDIFILCSFYEGFSLTLLEALKAGLPILASRVGGNIELLDNSSFQLFELNNKEDFLKKFLNIITNKDLALRISEENKKRGEKFSSQKMLDNYLKVIERLPV